MAHKKFLRFWSGVAAFALLLTTLLTPLAAMAVPLTISQDGPNIAVDSAFSVGTGEWRVKTTAMALPNSNGMTPNVSLVFAYSDPQNYSYANFATAAGNGLSGLYKVTNGVRSTISTYATGISANQSYEIEARHKDGAMRIYLGNTLLYKATNVTVAGTKLGVATVNGNATFSSTIHNLGTVNTTLNLSLVGGEPLPAATPPTVQLTTPAPNATVSGSQTVSATAADAQGVSAVQFQLDGNNLGAADASAPYAVSWDTTAAPNGSHTLTAIATNVASLVTASTGVVVMVNNTATPPPAATNSFTVSDGETNAGIDLSHATTAASEWRFSSTVTTGANSTTPANFSMVFGYVDPQNYYYANFATTVGSGLSGIYKVTNGTASRIVNYSTFINANATTDIEVRFKDGDARLYLNGVYLAKASGLTNLGSRVGVAALHGTATFSGTTVQLGATSSAASLTPTTIITNPENLYLCLPSPSSPVPTPSNGRQVAVSTSAQLKAAVLDAQPGDVITMADGTYSDTMLVGNYTGSFALTADGTASNPITLTGSRNAIIDGNGPSGRYGLYLKDAQYWNLTGFTVANAAKGIVLDGSNHVFMDNLQVTHVGDEAIHFRAFSSDNVVKGSEISYTGESSPQFGEGVYIGSASGANWGVYSGGLPDTSDRNVIVGNAFTHFTAEGIDVKEGSSKNYIAGNTFEGSAISGQNSADSWVDVKGNCNFLENNTGNNTLLDGFQVHNAIGTWGANNLFRNNTANVNAPGYGISINYNALNLGNLVECNNIVTNATAGAWNVPCVEHPL